MSDIAQITRQEFNALPLDELLEKLNAAHDIIATRDNLEQYAIKQIESKNIVGAANVLNIMMQSDAEYFRIDKLTPTPIIDKYDIADIIEFADEAEHTYDTKALKQLADYEQRYFVSQNDRLTTEAHGHIMLKTDVAHHEAEQRLKSYQLREETEQMHTSHKPYATVQCTKSDSRAISPNAYYTLYDFDQLLKELNEQAKAEGTSYRVRFDVLPPIDDEAQPYEINYLIGTEQFRGIANHIVREAVLLATLVNDNNAMERYSAEDAQYIRNREKTARKLAECIELDMKTQEIMSSVEQYTAQAAQRESEIAELRRSSYEPIVFFDNRHSESYEAEVRKFIFAKHSNENKWASSADIPQDVVRKYISEDDRADWNFMYNSISELLSDAACVCLGNINTSGEISVVSKIANEFSDLKELWGDCDYIKVYDNEGELHIESGKGNTVNHFELRTLNISATDYIDKTEGQPELKVHQALFVDETLTSKPMLAARVYGHPDREKQYGRTE